MKNLDPFINRSKKIRRHLKFRMKNNNTAFFVKQACRIFKQTKTL